MKYRMAFQSEEGGLGFLAAFLLREVFGLGIPCTE
jgi:hypothetical protein